MPHPPVPPHCLSPLFGPWPRGAAIGARLDPCGSRVPPGNSRNGHRCLVNAQKMRKNWGRNQLLWSRFFPLCVCKRLPNMDAHSCAKYFQSSSSYYRTIVISHKCTAKMFRVWRWCKFAGWGIRAFWRLTSTIVLKGVHHEKHKCTTREKGTVTMMKPWKQGDPCQNYKVLFGDVFPVLSMAASRNIFQSFELVKSIYIYIGSQKSPKVFAQNAKKIQETNEILGIWLRWPCISLNHHVSGW